MNIGHLAVGVPLAHGRVQRVGAVLRIDEDHLGGDSIAQDVMRGIPFAL